MRSLFQVVASMVFANAAVAYGADAKSAVSKLKHDAAAAAASTKSGAAEVAKDAASQAKTLKTNAAESVKEATKSSEAAQPSERSSNLSSTSPLVSMDSAKDAVKQVKAEGTPAAQAGSVSLITPESAVLPDGVVRARGVIAAGKATTGYDRDSKKIDLGATIRATGGAGVLEFAITDKISGQILVPFRSAGSFEVSDAAQFRAYVKQSSSYKDFYNQSTAYLKEKLPEALAAQAAAAAKAAAKSQGFSDQQANTLATQKQTQTLAAVKAAIAANASLNTEIPLTAFGLGTISASEKIGDGIDRVVSDAGVTAAASKRLATGLGDIELGAKYAVSSEKEPLIDGVPFYASVGLGVRLDTSGFKTAAADNKVATGRGTTDLGIRLNADYNIIQGLQLQVENQSEFMIKKGKTYKPASAGGFLKDYETGKLYTTATDVDYARSGMRQVGYAKLVFAAGLISSDLNSLKLNAKYSYDFDAKVKVDGVEQKDDATRAHNATVGLGFDGLQMGLPIQADLDYVLPLGGRNLGSAPVSTVATLKAYYKF